MLRKLKFIDADKGYGRNSLTGRSKAHCHTASGSAPIGMADHRNTLAASLDIGLSHEEIREARKVRDAERVIPASRCTSMNNLAVR